MSRLSRSPEWLQLPGGAVFDYTHPRARAFSVLDQRCVVSGWCTHPTIFNAVRRRLADPAFLLEDYEVSASPKIAPADLAWFENHWTGVLGVMRERTLSGRIWKGVQSEGKAITVISFWVSQQEVPASVVQLVVEALELPAPIFVDFMDSEESLEWSASAETRGNLGNSSLTKSESA